MTLSMGVLSNPSTNVADAGDLVTITLVTLVTSSSSNSVSGTSLPAAFTVDYARGSIFRTRAAELVLPVLTFSIVQSTNLSTGIATFTATCSHLPTSTAPAYGLLFEDTLPAEYAVPLFTMTPSAGTALGLVGRSFTLTRASLQLGETATIVFSAMINPFVAVVGSTFSNSMTLTAYANASAQPDAGAFRTYFLLSSSAATMTSVPSLEAPTITTNLPETTSAFWDPKYTFYFLKPIRTLSF